MKGRKKIIVSAIVIAVVVIAAAAVWAATKNSSKTETVSVMPATTSLQNGSLEQRVTASGTVQAADEYSIFIELSQEVKEVFAEVGDYVEEGQLLVTYDIEDDKKELQNKVTSAQITLDNANLDLENLVNPAEGTELLDLQTKVVNAEQTLNEAQKAVTDNQEDITDAKEDLDYYKQMLEMGGISQSEYDTAEETYNDLVKNQDTLESNLESAQLALETAQLNLENGQNRLNDASTMNSYQKQLNTVQTAEMNLSEAQDNLSKLTESTYSPISGTIIESSAVEGQMLTDSTSIMTIADLTNLDVLAYVSEYDIAKIAVGQDVELTSDGIEDKIYHGTVTKIEPTAESQGTISGSETVVPVLVHLTDNDDLIKPGMEFDMEFITVSLDNAQYVPISAVMADTENDGHYVYVVNDAGVIEKRSIETGVSDDMNLQVISGLTADDVIVESPDSTMQEGKNISDYATIQNVNSQSSDVSSEGSVLDGVLGGGGGAPSGGGGARGGGGMPMGGGPRG